jgi:hypothetical protein
MAQAVAAVVEGETQRRLMPNILTTSRVVEEDKSCKSAVIDQLGSQVVGG